jgi:hypothetical protein
MLKFKFLLLVMWMGVMREVITNAEAEAVSKESKMDGRP